MIYCIVVTSNGMIWLERHIASIRSSSIPLKTIIIDNSSVDGTLEYLNLHFNEAYVIKSNQNLGFGKANNLGVKYAIENGAEFVFLLNQDAYLLSDTIEKCIEEFKISENVALVSPVHLDGSGKQLDIGFQRCLTNELCPGFFSDLVLNNRKNIYPIYSVNAAAWLLKVSVINEIGLFSQAFFHYGEDINFQQRLVYFGYKSLLVPNAYVLHDRKARNGEKSELGKKIEIKTNQMTILMNINEPFNKVVKSVWKYAGLLLFEGKIIKSLELLLDTYWYRTKYLKWRKEMNGKISL